MAKKNLEFGIKAKDKTGEAFDSVKTRLQGLKQGLGGVKAAIGAAFAVAAVAAIGKFISSTIDAGDELQKLSVRLGASTEALSQLQFVADISGVSMGQMTNGLKKLGKSASDASLGLSTPKRAFDQLGLSVDSFKKLRPTDQFLTLADALEGVENPSDRTRIAMDLMGRAGVDLLSAMDGGADAIRGLMKEADQMGLTMTRVEADNMAKFNDTLTRMGGSVKGFGQRIVINMLPALNSMAEWFSSILPKAADVFTDYLKFVVNFWTEALQKFIDGLSFVADLLSNLPLVGDKFKEWSTSLDNTSLSLENFQTKLKQTGSSTTEVTTKVQEQSAVLTDTYAPAVTTATQATSELDRAARRVKASIATPMENLNKELATLDELLAAGKLTFDEYGRAVEKAWDKVETKTTAVSEKIKTKTEDTWTRAGDSIESFVKRGEFSLDGFKSTAFGILEDIAKNWIDKMIGLPGPGGGGGGGGSFDFGNIVGSIGDFFGFAKGGVMSSSGPLPVQSYASGGVATSPQLAVFGEGARNEAFVPLPDGKRIPVALQGQGAGSMVVNQTLNITTGVQQTVRAELMQMMPQIIAATTSGVEDARRRGGNFAQAFS